ncbi:YczE/YyaS/YitT family protein [Microbacterium yannicii]|uniref:membrane protein YczE n=1 Tax=Microbacterium yannicii TaxID=671622 RepID=UPI00031FA88B|nr:membrane protein [Microbacterium yannicii]
MSRRILQLLVGLVIYGVGCALTIEAGLGVDPWTVFAQGLSIHTGIGVGWVTNILGFFVLLLWIPLRQKPGVGTIANILLVGTSMQAALWLIPPMSGIVVQLAVLLAGIVLVAIASGLYIGARFGPGPRDGLMTGMHARLGWPIWLSRALVELTVLLIGWLLGGTVGIGTVLFALLIGPLVHIALPLLDTRRSPTGSTGPASSPAAQGVNERRPV